MKISHALWAFLFLAIAFPSFGANIVVTSVADNGPGTLRQAVADAAAGDTISFAPSISTNSITLNTEILITKSLSIMGPILIRGEHNTRLFEVRNSTLTIEMLELVDGDAGFDFGGAIWVDGGTLKASYCVFVRNQGLFGGAVALEDSAGFIYSSLFESNVAEGSGGAIYTTSNLRIENSTFATNQSPEGGAIFIGDTHGNEVIIASSTFYRNAADFAGAILNDHEASVTLQNTLIAGNDASETSCGGNIQAGADSIATDNPGTCGNSRVATFESLNLGTLANNGGPTPTIALLAGSIAIDSGSNSLVGSYTNRNYDQRGIGFPRILPVNGVVDVGAFEAPEPCDASKPPVLICPADKVFIRSDTSGQVVEGISPIVTNLCENAFLCDHDSGDFFPNGVTTVTCAIQGQYNTLALCSFKVTVAAKGSDQCLCPADGTDTDDPDTSGVDTSDSLNINSNSSASGCNSTRNNSVSDLALIVMFAFFGLWRAHESLRRKGASRE